MHPLLLQACYRIAQFIIRSVLKSADQSDVTSGLRDHKSNSNRRKRHRIANNLDVGRDLFTVTLDLQLNGLQTITAHVLRNLFAGPVDRLLAVDFQDSIAKAQAGARGGRAVDNRLNIDAVVVTQNLHADAIETR